MTKLCTTLANSSSTLPHAFRNLKTYAQSGNVAFYYPTESDSSNVDDILAKHSTELIEEHLGHSVVCLARSFSLLETLLQSANIARIFPNPFLHVQEGFLLVQLFSRPLNSEETSHIAALFDGHEKVAFSESGSELAIWCPNGISKSFWMKVKWEKELPGLDTTSRNWRSLKATIALAQ